MRKIAKPVIDLIALSFERPPSLDASRTYLRWFGFYAHHPEQISPSEISFLLH